LAVLVIAFFSCLDNL